LGRVGLGNSYESGESYLFPIASACRGAYGAREEITRRKKWPPTRSAGFAVQAVGLLQGRALPPWQSVLFLIGTLLVGTPDGLEIVNLSASVLMGVALVPYGIKLIAAAL
jgi:hypothetical protein